MWQPNGLTTGVGSLPYREPEPALYLIAANLDVPHWPQLPRRGAQEGFVQQFLTPLVDNGLLVREGEKLVFPTDAPDWPDRLAAFYALYLAAEEGDEAALETFAIPREAAVGFWAFLQALESEERWPCLKGQVVGPLTAGFQLTDAAGRPAYYDEQVRDLLVRNLAMSARWQAAVLARYAGRAMVFVDEPGVSIYGQSTYITVTREMIVEDMGAIAAAVSAAGAIPGIHSCAAVDWSLLYDAGAAVVSLDAYEYFDSLRPFRRETLDFLDRGGILAWGVVPTSEKARRETGATLAARLRSYWRELAEWGASPEQVRAQALITPACGTGALEPELAERIYGLTHEVGALLREGGE
ncbi:MAG: hypothetical protein QME76_07780 [Bacillota bacterium]|nr:hypothetical protein [Bacillota bacterium]